MVASSRSGQLKFHLRSIAVSGRLHVSWAASSAGYQIFVRSATQQGKAGLSDHDQEFGHDGRQPVVVTKRGFIDIQHSLRKTGTFARSLVINTSEHTS